VAQGVGPEFKPESTKKEKKNLGNTKRGPSGKFNTIIKMETDA
jgi:hypothetical protein